MQAVFIYQHKQLIAKNKMKKTYIYQSFYSLKFFIHS